MPRRKVEISSPYNEELKRIFFITGVQDAFKAKFSDMFKSCEKKLKKDVFEFTIDDVISGMESTGEYEPWNIRKFLSFMKRLIEIGDERGICDKRKNGFYIIDKNSIPIEKQIAKNLYLNPDQIKDVIFSHYKIASDDVKIGVNRTYVIPVVVLFWSGIEQPTEVLVKDVDFEHHTVFGKKIDDALWPLIFYYAENCGITDTPDSSATFLRHTAYERKNKSDSISRKTAVATLYDEFFFDCRFLNNNLRMAGIFYRIYKDDTDITIKEKVLNHFGNADIKQARQKIADYTSIAKAYCNLAREYDTGVVVS